MYRTILTPLDGSPFSELALPFAEVLAGASGGTLVLIRAVSPHTAPLVDPIRGQVAMLDDAERYLEAISRAASGAPRVETGVYFGAPDEAILQEIGIRRADAVVMASHGRTGPGRTLFGSVADRVLRRSPVPVLVVPARCDHMWDRGRPIRIVVPLDGSGFSEVILSPVRDLLATLQRGPGAAVTLVRVVDTSPAAYYGDAAREMFFDPEVEQGRARVYLERRAAALDALVPRMDIHVRLGRPGASIAEAARELGADLIAMATHGRGGVSRLLLGSVASDTLRQTHVPILFARPAALRRHAKSEDTAGTAGAGVARAEAMATAP
ncbi:MAG TPA: universal stress protein [Chloroflexota bacterium]|nr:universal stress protein [Chloroflexota bacterium]